MVARDQANVHKKTLFLDQVEGRVRADDPETRRFFKVCGLEGNHCGVFVDCDFSSCQVCSRWQFKIGGENFDGLVEKGG